MAAADDLKRDVGFVGSPVHEPTGIAAIGEDVGDKGEALAGRLERQLAAVAVLDIGAVDAEAEQPTIGVGQDVALAPCDFLARVIAFFAPF